MHRTRLILTFLMLALLAAPSFAAAARKCPPGCKHRSRSAQCAHPSEVAPVTKQAPPAAPTLASQLLAGLEVAAGFRWAPEHDCPTLEIPDPPTEPRDPFYLGVGLRVPLASWVDWHGRFDRDWTAEPQWQIRAELVAMPWKKP